LRNLAIRGAEGAPSIGASCIARLLSLVTLVILPIGAHAQRAAAPARTVASLDVAGVRLGMPKAQADAALAAASYECKPFGREDTFEERVEDEVTRRRGGTVPWGQVGSGPREMNCEGPNGEELKVEWAQVRGGPIVDEFRLIVDPKRVDQQALRSQALTKYGKPTVGTPMLGSWCDPGYECRGGLVFSVGPVLMVDAANGLDIMAGRGKRAHDADDAAVIAEATRLAPAKSNAAF
jgi:hypothetical protein